MYRGKVDLHLHLDGSLSVSFVYQQMTKNGLSIPTDLEAALVAPVTCRNLAQYLRCFEIPNLILQYADALERCAYDLVKRLANEGIIYAEIRFAPAYHCKRGLSQKDVVEAVICGIKHAERDYPSIRVGLLLCFIVGDENNQETLKTGIEFAGYGVSGMDLAGPEGRVPLESYKHLFEKIRSEGIPFTIHAGECGDYNNILTAISYGAKRIGHGVAACQSFECMQTLRDLEITVECCFTSNLQTRAVKKAQDHPFYKFYQFGIPVTVNTDNLTVSDTTLSKEHELLARHFPLTDEDFVKIDAFSIQGAFITQEEKKQLMSRIVCEP